MDFEAPETILSHRDHRSDPVPHGPWLMTMSWVDLLAAHWPVEPRVLEERIPSKLTLDTFEGDAWVSATPFVMDNTLPRGMSWWPRPPRFVELNLRTYVTMRGRRPGIWFFSLDATSRLAVAGARTVFFLPYYRAGGEVDSRDDRITCRLRRKTGGEFVASYSPTGAVKSAEPGTLDHWLMERYWLYCTHRRRLYRAGVHHRPWPLQPAQADIEVQTLLEATNLPVSGSPARLHYARRLDVLAWFRRSE